MIEYRVAEASDAEAVASLHARSWRANYRGAFTDSFLDGDLHQERLGVWRKRLSSPPHNQFVLLAVDGVDLGGFVCVYGAEDPHWGSFVDNLHVDAACKRSGIGSSLMIRAGVWLDEGYSDLGVYLWVLEVNARARSFYESLGAANAGQSLMETHGGAMVRSCRYTWERPERMAAGQPLSEMLGER